ncbi:hypothetical protein [Piscinibacter sp. HJYY11]|uniref:hypothetical protein n=1 Tax=Piscinibacter sp. HJYY11 TaxID=2801333 RepID=UPI00191C95A8|nr:hypothetical protein [Piscinibacter sp. HJYY11]MBL0726070.1 hypothetical protein [Piscinibacter sp. HJYY11]
MQKRSRPEVKWCDWHAAQILSDVTNEPSPGLPRLVNVMDGLATSATANSRISFRFLAA